MTKLITYLVTLLTLLPTAAFPQGRIQNEDVKSLAEIQSAVLTTTGNLASGNVCITSPGSITGLRTGLYVYDASNPTYISAGTTIVAIPGTCSAGQIQMSLSATHIATGDTITFGGQMSQLPNDTKIFITALGLNEQLSTAISNGDIGGGGGSGGGYSSVQQLAQKAEQEHFGIYTDPFDNAITSGFNRTPTNYYVNGVLLDTVTSGTNVIVPVYGPVTLSSTDKNTSTTTGWTTEGNASNLTTSATTKIGSTSVSFDKTVGGTSATIKYDAGSTAAEGVAGNTDLWFWINLPNATGVSDIKIIVDQNGTDFQTCTSAFNYSGGSLVTGWNLMNFNLATCGTGSGAGWTPSNGFRYFHIGIDALSGAAYSGVLVNAIMFSLTNPALFTPFGSKLSLYDNVHRESVVISSGNTSVVGGGVTLGANVGNTYVGGFGTSGATLARHTLAVGSNQALMTGTDQFGNTIAGAETLTQEVRFSRPLPTALSSSTLNAFAEVNTSQVYKVVSTGSNTIVVVDTVDQHLDLLSGETVHVFRSVPNNGKNGFIKRGDMTLSTNSGNAGGQTTLTCSGGGCVPAGTVAGDYVVKKHITMNFTANAIGSNESFSAMTPVAAPNDVQLYDNGIPVPNQSTIVALYGLGAPNAQKNQFGTLPDLTMIGTVNQQAQFKNGQLGSTGWSGSNYYEAVGTAGNVSGQTIMSVSFWRKPAQSPEAGIIVGDYTGTTNGWYLNEDGSGRVQVVVNNTTYLDAGPVLIPGNWYHEVWNFNAGGGQLYVNGALVASATTGTVGTPNSTGAGLRIGNPSAIPNAGEVVSQVAVWIGSNLSSTQVNQLYNQGLAQILGFGPRIRYLFQNGSVSGQWIGQEAILQTDTVNVRPFFGKIGITK